MSKVERDVLVYTIKDPMELNLSYMPFIADGGLFVPTEQVFNLGERVLIDLQLPEKNDPIRIIGKVVWITPKNAFHHVVSGVGVQFTADNPKTLRAQIEASLDKVIEVGGYTYGIMAEIKHSN
jgi:type IV pilus assembly protein PilZ